MEPNDVEEASSVAPDSDPNGPQPHDSFSPESESHDAEAASVEATHVESEDVESQDATPVPEPAVPNDGDLAAASADDALPTEEPPAEEPPTEAPPRPDTLPFDAAFETLAPETVADVVAAFETIPPETVADVEAAPEPAASEPAASEPDASEPAAAEAPQAKAANGAAPSGAAQASAVQSTTDEGYRVKLPMFEGPLDLLLHLVKKHELDILNIPIAFITEKYVAYIKLLDELNIDVASEYLLMAATLVHIKSRMLLPNPPTDDADEGLSEEDVDPRAELVRRLLEYQKYKLAAEQLGNRPVLGRDVFPRGSSEEVASGQPGLEQVSMFKLLEAFQAILERSQKTKDHQIDFERFSITEKISELMDRLNVEKKLVFHEIFTTDSSRAELIITFLAILEMTRLRLTRLRQDGPLEPIYIELRVSEEDALAEPAEDTESSGDDEEYE